MIRHPIALALLVLTGCDSGGAESILGRNSFAAVSDPIPAAGVTFRCTPIKLYDGDGPIWCAEGQRIRLAGIAAREMDGTCRANQPCPEASAEAARDRLAALLSYPDNTGRIQEEDRHLVIAGPALSCTSTGSAGGKRVGAWCVSPVAGDLSCAMLASGTVLVWSQYWQNHDCGRGAGGGYAR